MPEKNTVYTDMATLSPLLMECLAQGTDVVLPITGTSMLPLLRAGIDRVLLTSVPATGLKKGDIPLYRRRNGQFVLHRIAKVDADGFTMVGDNQQWLEPGIAPDQLLAVVKGIYRGDRYRPCTHRGYRLWVQCWLFLLPVRKLFLRPYHFCRQRIKKS